MIGVVNFAVTAMVRLQESILAAVKRWNNDVPRHNPPSLSLWEAETKVNTRLPHLTGKWLVDKSYPNWPIGRLSANDWITSFVSCCIDLATTPWWPENTGNDGWTITRGCISGSSGYAVCSETFVSVSPYSAILGFSLKGTNTYELFFMNLHWVCSLVPSVPVCSFFSQFVAPFHVLLPTSPPLCCTNPPEACSISPVFPRLGSN